MSSLIRSRLVERMSSPGDTGEDFPFDFIMKEFFKPGLDEVDGIDADIVDCAVRYYDAKHDEDGKAMDEAVEELKKLIG